MDLKYHVYAIDRDKKSLVTQHPLTIEAARSTVGTHHGASHLPYFWAINGLGWLALTADGQNPNTPLVARFSVERSF